MPGVTLVVPTVPVEPGVTEPFVTAELLVEPEFMGLFEDDPAELVVGVGVVPEVVDAPFANEAKGNINEVAVTSILVDFFILLFPSVLLKVSYHLHFTNNAKTTKNRL